VPAITSGGRWLQVTEVREAGSCIGIPGKCLDTAQQPPPPKMWRLAWGPEYPKGDAGAL
jgi:hypothetical protein